jgi:hypothetical protein
MKFICIYAGESIDISKETSTWFWCFKHIYIACEAESPIINDKYLSSCILTISSKVHCWFNVVNKCMSKAIGFSDERWKMTVKFDRWKMINKH